MSCLDPELFLMSCVPDAKRNWKQHQELQQLEEGSGRQSRGRGRTQNAKKHQKLGPPGILPSLEQVLLCVDRRVLWRPNVTNQCQKDSLLHRVSCAGQLCLSELHLTSPYLQQGKTYVNDNLSADRRDGDFWHHAIVLLHVLCT